MTRKHRTRHIQHPPGLTLEDQRFILYLCVFRPASKITRNTQTDITLVSKAGLLRAPERQKHTDKTEAGFISPKACPSTVHGPIFERLLLRLGTAELLLPLLETLPEKCELLVHKVQALLRERGEGNGGLSCEST
jgi:hypothetical protein